MFFRCEAKSYKAEAKGIIRQSQQDFFRWEADIIIKQADITFRVLQFPQISDVKVYLQTVKIELATVTSIWLVIPLFRHYQSLDDGSLYVHLARALTWDNSDIISSPVDGEFQIGILSIQHPAAWQCLLSERKNGQTGIFRYRFKKGGPTVWDIYRDDTIPHSKTKS